MLALLITPAQGPSVPLGPVPVSMAQSGMSSILVYVFRERGETNQFCNRIIFSKKTTSVRPPPPLSVAACFSDLQFPLPSSFLLSIH